MFISAVYVHSRYFIVGSVHGLTVVEFVITARDPAYFMHIAT